MGDIFFYITDRLLVPYACRNAQGSTPFMCRDFQKRLQTNDQVCPEKRLLNGLRNRATFHLVHTSLKRGMV